MSAIVDVESVDLFKSRRQFLDVWMFQENTTIMLTLPVPKIDLSMTLKVIEKLYYCFNKDMDRQAHQGLA